MHSFICLGRVLAAIAKSLFWHSWDLLLWHVDSLVVLLTDQWIRERWGDKQYDFLWTVGWEDGRPMSQSNHLVSIRRPSSFIQPEGGKIWKTKVKRQNRELETVKKKSTKDLQSCRTSQDWPASGMCVLSSSFHSWAGSVYLPVSWEKLLNRQAEG